MDNNIYQQLSLLNGKELFTLIQNFKDKFSYYVSNQEAFLNLFKSYGINISEADYLEFTSFLDLKEKIQKLYDILLDDINNKQVSFLLSYKAVSNVFGYKNQALDVMLKSNAIIGLASKSYRTGKGIAKTGIVMGKTMGKLGYMFFSMLLTILGRIWGFLGFIFSVPGFIVVLVVSLVLIIITIIIVLLTLMYQPLLNVPVKFSSYEMYVPLNNDEVAFKNVNTDLQKIKNIIKNKSNFGGKILDGLTANLANKNDILLFLKNNQSDLLKGFAFKCSKYSLIKTELLKYNTEKNNLSEDIDNLTGQISKLTGDKQKLDLQLSGYIYTKKQLTDRILKISDKLGSYNSIKNNITYSGNDIIGYKSGNKQYMFTGNIDNTYIVNINNSSTSISALTGILVDNTIFTGDIKLYITKSLNLYTYTGGVYKNIGDLTSIINKLSQQQTTISNSLNNINKNIDNIKQQIKNIENKVIDLKKKLSEIKNKLNNLKSLYKDKFKALGIENASNNIIEGDLFNGGFGVNKLFYTWYKKELSEKGYKINDTICSNVVRYGYQAYIAPSWKTYNDTMVPGGEAYTILFLDNINGGKDKIVDNNITEKDYDIFQKYYNSIVGLYKQLGKILVLKNWISGKFTVRPQGLLGMDIITNESESVVNIYNPFLFLKNSITLLDNDNNNKSYIKYNGFDIDVSKFNNWFYDAKAENITKLATNNGLDILYDSNKQTTYIPIKVDNNFVNNVCGIQGTLKNNLIMYIGYNGNSFYQKAVNYVDTYNACLRSCRENCDPYERCYKPIFLNTEKPEKQQTITNSYNAQTSAYCSQLENYLNKFQALNNIKKDKFEDTPSKIQVCYEEKPVFFDYMFKYNIKAYYHTNSLLGNNGQVKEFLDTRDSKYHYTNEGMYIPYFYKVRLPYKVCYTIDNIYLLKKLKEKLVKKGGVVNNYYQNNGKLGFILDGHIDLELKSSVFFKTNNYPTIWQTERIMYQILNKGAKFNPEKLLNILSNKEGLYSNLFLGLNISLSNDSIKYKYFTFTPNTGREGLSIQNSYIGNLNTRFTSSLYRDNKSTIDIESNGYRYILYKKNFWGNYEPEDFSFLNTEGVINKLYTLNNIEIAKMNEDNDFIKNNLGDDEKLVVNMGGSLSFDNNKLIDHDLTKTLLENNIVNTFKLKENIYLSTTLNFIKSQLFNIDLASLKQGNNIQSLLFFGNTKQVNTYYTLHIISNIIKDKVSNTIGGDTTLKTAEQQLENNLNQIKQKYQQAKEKNTGTGLWNNILAGINLIKDEASGIFSSTKEIVGNIYSGIKNNITSRIGALKSNTIPNSCVFSLDPVKCSLDSIDIKETDDEDILDKLLSRFELSTLKGGLSFNGDNKIRTSVILGRGFIFSPYTLSLNVNNIKLNPFYSLFRKTEDKKTEERIGIYSNVSNILTTTNPNNVLKTLGIDKYNIKILVENMLNNNYIIDRLSKALKHIKVSGLDTTALDNLTSIKYNDIDIYALNRILFNKFILFNVVKDLKQNIISYYTDNIKKDREIRLSLFKVWFLYHAYKDKYILGGSPLIKQIDDILLKELGKDKIISFINNIEKNNINFSNNYSWYDIIGKYKDKNKQYQQFRDIMTNIENIFNNMYICINPSEKYKFDNNIILYNDITDNKDHNGGSDNSICKKSIILSSKNLTYNKLFLEYLLGTDDSKGILNDNTLLGLLDTASFISYYTNKEYSNGGIDNMELYSIANKDHIYSKDNLYLDMVLKIHRYITEGYTNFNMDTNFIYKLMNGTKIGKQNDIAYTTYLVNVFSQIDKSIRQLKSIFTLLSNIKQNNKIYEIVDVYLLDLLANQNNYISNISMINGLDINTYTQIKNYIDSSYLPIFTQYNLFDALSKKNILSYLDNFNHGVNLDSYYFNLFKKEFKEKINCADIFSGDELLKIKCGLIKEDLLSASNLTDFKFRMTKYAKEYGFEELWKQVGGLLYFVYQNQKYLGQAWNFKETNDYNTLTQQYGANWTKQIQGADGNCTWYTNYLHFKDKVGNGQRNGIPGNAKDWCKNAEKIGYVVKYTKDIINPTSQLKIGDVVVFDENYPTYYNYQMKKYGTTYGHVGTLIGIDDNNNAVLVEEMNYTTYIKGGTTLWSVDRRWDTDWKKSTKCFIEAGNFNWNYDNIGTGE